MSNLASCTKSAIGVPPQSKTRAPTDRTLSVFDMKKYGAAKERQRLHRMLCGGDALADLYREVVDPFTRKGKDGQPLVKNKRGGCHWWGKPGKEMALKLGCTERQLKYRLRVLRERGLIDYCAMDTHGVMRQVRPTIAGGAAFINGWPDASNYDHLLHVAKARSLAGKGREDDVCTFLGRTDFVLSIEGADFVLSKSLGLKQLGLEEVGLSLHAQTPRAEPDENLKILQDKPTATPEAVPTPGDVESEAEVVSQNQPAPPVPPAPPKGNSAHAIWQREFLLTNPGGYIAFKDKDRRGLKTLAGKLPPSLPYAQFVAILMGTGRWVGIDRANWSVLRAECGFDPDIPMLRQVQTTERLTALVNAVRKLDAAQAAHSYVTPDWKLKNIAAKKAADASKVIAPVTEPATTPESGPPVALASLAPCAGTPAPIEPPVALIFDAVTHQDYLTALKAGELEVCDYVDLVRAAA